jgi:hypothetical protein
MTESGATHRVSGSGFLARVSSLVRFKEDWTRVGLSVRGPLLTLATAILFDLLNGGDKDWGRMPPYWELGWEATQAASGGPFALGTAGGGYGATTATFKGGVGSASAVTASGFTVGAIVVRTLLTMVVVWLLAVPGLLFAGGALLIWIAYKLLLPEPEDDNGVKLNSVNGFWAAIRTIVVADIVMGLDNVLAVAGAAQLDKKLLREGLAVVADQSSRSGAAKRRGGAVVT